MADSTSSNCAQFGECSNATANCSPCGCTSDSPSPVLPKCDIALSPNGVFTNATVTVVDGCISAVSSGTAFQYTPEPCCAPASSGGGSQGLQGARGEAGRAATISIGNVSTAGAGQPAQVTNTGTSSDAVLNFVIPQGQQGEAAPSAGGTTGTVNGLEVNNGLVTGLPMGLVSVVAATSTSTDIDFNAATSDAGAVTITLNVDNLVSMLKSYTDDAVNNAVSPLISQINSLSSRVSALEASKNTA